MFFLFFFLCYFWWYMSSEMKPVNAFCLVCYSRVQFFFFLQLHTVASTCNCTIFFLRRWKIKVVYLFENIVETILCLAVYWCCKKELLEFHKICTKNSLLWLLISCVSQTVPMSTHRLCFGANMNIEPAQDKTYNMTCVTIKATYQTCTSTQYDKGFPISLFG